MIKMVNLVAATNEVANSSSAIIRFLCIVTTGSLSKAAAALQLFSKSSYGISNLWYFINKSLKELIDNSVVLF